MPKPSTRQMLVIVLAIPLLTASDCPGPRRANEPTPIMTIQPEGPLTFRVGEGRPLLVVMTGGTGRIATYTSSAPGVVSVNMTGEILCLTPGTARITVTSTDNPPVTGSVVVVCVTAQVVPPFIDILPTSITFDHILGVTPCPQRIGTIRVTNVTALTATVVSTGSDSPLIAVEAGAVMGPGEIKQLAVDFLCGTTTPLTATITVTARIDATSDTGTVTVIGRIRPRG